MVKGLFACLFSRLEVNAKDVLKIEFKYIYSNTIVFEPDKDPIIRKGTYLVRLKGSGFKG